MIGNGALCKHANGNNLVKCTISVHSSSFKREHCQEYCTSHKPCLGYEFTGGSSKKCHLVTSDNSCPTAGYNAQYRQFQKTVATIEEPETMATTWQDIAPSEKSGYYPPACYGKHLGKLDRN